MGVFSAEARSRDSHQYIFSVMFESGGRVTMGNVVNFRKARKDAKRQHDGQRAATNRLLHGRSNAERKLDAARDAKARRVLDQHRVETGDER